MCCIGIVLNGMCRGSEMWCDLMPETHHNAIKTCASHSMLAFSLSLSLFHFLFLSPSLPFQNISHFHLLCLALMFVFDFKIVPMCLFTAIVCSAYMISFRFTSFRSIRFYFLLISWTLMPTHLGGSILEQYQLLCILCHNK